MTESQSPIFAYTAAVSKSNNTLHPGEPQDVSHHDLNQDGLLTNHDKLSSAVHSRTTDESSNSIVLESPPAKLQTGKYMIVYTCMLGRIWGGSGGSIIPPKIKQLMSKLVKIFKEHSHS